MGWFEDNAAALEEAGISQEQAKDWASRNTNPDGTQDTHRLIEANTNYTGDRMYDSQGPEINNGNGPLARQVSTQRDASGNPMNGGGSSYGSFASGGSFGAAPDPFGETYTPTPWGETYTPLARPSYLSGEYVPGQWGETFAPPAKPTSLQTEYALPTQAELEASPGYTAGADLMQRGMERSAASRGSVLSGGFVGRTLPRAMGEYSGTAYNNLAGQTMGARQQNYGEYTGDVSNAFQQYQQRYGQFADAEGLKLGARGVNENAFQGDQSANLGGYQARFNTHLANEAGNLAGYNTRYNKYLDTAGMKRQADNDVWGRERDLSDLSLRAAALARPY